MKQKIFIGIVVVFFCSHLQAQNTEVIPLQFDVSGYGVMNSDDSDDSVSRGATVNYDTIPTIKTEMNVNAAGALTYMVPFEVLKGVNNFQPNIGLAYNSQSGNGMAGWGLEYRGAINNNKGWHR